MYKKALLLIFIFTSHITFGATLTEAELLKSISENPNIEEIDCRHNLSKKTLKLLSELKNLKIINIRGSAKILKEVDGVPMYLAYNTQTVKGKDAYIIHVNGEPVPIFEQISIEFGNALFKIKTLREIKIHYGRMPEASRIPFSAKRRDCKIWDNINKV